MRSAKTLIAVTLLSLSSYMSASAQLMNHPESIVYDSERDRYLVSNWDSGDMIQIDSDGVQDYFIVNQFCYAGMQIIGDVIYVSGRDQGVRGFDLETGQQVMHVILPGSAMLNDMTSDNQGYLYVSAPNANQIYKIDPITGNWSTFVSSGVSSPNGLYFDEPHNRLLLVSSRNSSPLQAISLADSSVSVIAYTGLSILDGLTMDSQRNIYFSSWNSNAVYKYDSTFTNPPEQVSVHSPSPADIFFNTDQNVLAVPVFYGNYIDFVEVSPTSPVYSEVSRPYEMSIRNYPNPFNSSTAIIYHLDFPSDISIDIYDMLGRKVETIFSGFQSIGVHRENWNAEDASSGAYYLSVQANGNSVYKKIMFLK